MIGQTCTGVQQQHASPACGVRTATACGLVWVAALCFGVRTRVETLLVGKRDLCWRLAELRLMTHRAFATCCIGPQQPEGQVGSSQMNTLTAGTDNFTVCTKVLQYKLDKGILQSPGHT